MTVLYKIQIGADSNHYEYTPTQDGKRWICTRGSPYAEADQVLVLVRTTDMTWIAYDAANQNFNPQDEGRPIFKAYHNSAVTGGWHAWSYNANVNKPGMPPKWEGEIIFVTKVLVKKEPSGSWTQKASRCS